MRNEAHIYDARVLQMPLNSKLSIYLRETRIFHKLRSDAKRSLSSPSRTIKVHDTLA